MVAHPPLGEVMSDEYEIEPDTWIGAPPGAGGPVPPRSQFVPWKGPLQPGYYYSHTAGVFEPKAPKIQDFYKEGLRVKAEPPTNLSRGKNVFRPTARGYNVSPFTLKQAPHGELLQRMGNWFDAYGSMARPHMLHRFMRTPEGKVLGEDMYPVRRAPRIASTGTPTPATIVGRLEPGTGFNPQNPAYKQLAGAEIARSAKGHLGHRTTTGFEGQGVIRHTGHIDPKTIVAHFPKGSDVAKTPATGARGFGPMAKGFGLNLGLMLGLPDLQGMIQKAGAEQREAKTERRVGPRGKKTGFKDAHGQDIMSDYFYDGGI